MALDDVYRLLIVFSNAQSGEELSMSLSGRQNVATAPDINALGDDVKNDWWATSAVTGQKVYHSGDISLIRVTLRRIDPLEPVESIYTTGLPIAGISSANSLPPATSTVISKRTANIGRRFRGRMYLPPVTENYSDAGGAMPLIDAQAMDTLITALDAALVVDRFEPIVFSPEDMGATPPRPGTFKTRIANYRVDRRFRAQRRRTNPIPVYG